MRKHIPVLLNEAVSGLLVAPGKKFIDATYGGGGHAKEIVDRGGIVLGIDTDPDTGAVQGNFRNIVSIARDHGFDRVDGVLFDLGVSSHQLDTPTRGFSYRFPDAPLDLRLDQRGGISAAEYIKNVTEGELYEVLAKFGEINRAHELAHDITRARPVTTGDLLNIVGKKLAPQLFQALRITVNDEFGALREGLSGAQELIKPGGRLVVISFHSLEDRIVKMFMRGGDWHVVTKKPIVPSDREFVENKRSRSAKLRIAEKL